MSDGIVVLLLALVRFRDSMNFCAPYKTLFEPTLSAKQISTAILCVITSAEALFNIAAHRLHGSFLLIQVLFLSRQVSTDVHDIHGTMLCKKY